MLLCIFIVLLSFGTLQAGPFVIFYVEAAHLDYSSFPNLLQSIKSRKHRDVGHAWIHLEGKIGEKNISITGGHSGELGIIQPKYLDGVMDLLEKNDPNPIQYLWEMQKDGFFQKGSGKHKPTSSLKINLTQQQFEKIFRFVQNYNYKEYCLTHHQCCTFVAQIAELIGLHLETDVSVKIPPRLGKDLLLWSDSMYSTIRFASPDILERSIRGCLK